MPMSTLTPWIPKVVYSSGPAVTLQFSLPMTKRWEPSSKGWGGYGVSDAGVPAAFEFYRAEMVRVYLNFLESEWPSVHNWIVWAQRNAQTPFTFQFDRNVATPLTVYLDDPAMGTDIKPTRSGGNYLIAYELAVVLRDSASGIVDRRAYG